MKTANTVTKKTKLYIIANHYNVLDDNVNDNDADDKCVNGNTNPTRQALLIATSTKIILTQPVFIKDILNFSNLLTELTALIGSNSVVCKSTSIHLKFKSKNLIIIENLFISLRKTTHNSILIRSKPRKRLNSRKESSPLHPSFRYIFSYRSNRLFNKTSHQYQASPNQNPFLYVFY